MMLNDAGYSILISIVAAIAARKFKFAGMGKKLVQLMAFVVYLVCLGSYFWGMVWRYIRLETSVDKSIG